MIKLITSFSKEEELALEVFKEDIQVLSVLDKPYYLLNYSGEFTFEECFGKTNSSIEREQRYELAKPRRVIKIFHYYLIEHEDELGEWYIGSEQKNGAIEGRAGCESLQFALRVL